MSRTIDSMTTALVRATARDDAEKWSRHCRACADCARSRHHRGAIPPCMTGRRLLRNVADSAEQLAEAIRLDAAPPPGQLTFDDLLTPGDLQ